MNTEELLAKFKVESLSDMQRDVVDTLLTRTCNVIVLSPTGSGKTLAYLLPLVQTFVQNLFHKVEILSFSSRKRESRAAWLPARR